VSIRENGLSTISDQITMIKQQLQTFKNSAKGQYTTQVNDLTNALNSLSSSFDAAKASPSASTLATLASSVRPVVTADRTSSPRCRARADPARGTAASEPQHALPGLDFAITPDR
jgi:hypothetical protein